MNATNHMVTGTVIALAVNQPLLAAPLSLLSHYVLDAMPHFGFRSWEERTKYQTLMRAIIIIDAFLFVLFILFLKSKNVTPSIYIIGLFAVIPDLAWVYRYVVTEKMGTIAPGQLSFINKFHSELQTRELPNGFYIEYAYLISILFILNWVFL